MRTALLLLLWLPTTSWAQHVLDVFAYERPGNPILGSHTFAVLDQKWTISWGPASDPVRLLRPQDGRNYTWAETLEQARANGATVYYVGRAQLTEEEYQRGLRLLAVLADGRVSYQLRGHLNCIHAVASISGRPLNTGLAHGVEASRLVLAHFKSLPVFGVRFSVFSSENRTPKTEHRKE